MIRSFSLALPMIAALGSPALAQDALADNDWTGFYVGIATGSARIDRIETNFMGVSNTIDGDDLNYDVSTRAIHAGYLHDFGRLVTGAELQYDRLDFDTDFTIWTIAPDSDVTRLKLRAGYDAGRFLPYATLGYGWSDHAGQSHDGPVWGVGVDFQITPNIVLGTEFLRSRYGYVDIGPASSAGSSDDDLFVDSLHLRLSYRF